MYAIRSYYAGRTIYTRRREIPLAGAVAAAHAVKGVDLHAVLQALELLALGLDGLEGLRGLGQLGIGGQHREQGRVRADRITSYNVCYTKLLRRPDRGRPC